MLGNLFSSMIAKVLGVGLVAALLGLAVQTIRAERWQDRAKAEAVAHKQTVANVFAAQVEAARIAIERERAKAATYASQKEQTDARQTTLAADFVARGRQLERVRPQAPSCPASGAGASSQGAVAPVDHGSDRPAFVVAEADVDACSVIAARLVTAREWGEALVKEGLAE